MFLGSFFNLVDSMNSSYDVIYEHLLFAGETTKLLWLATLFRILQDR